ncbi:MAG: 4-hydroxy-tetrahydrodipicolinate synthase [Lachnospiraceae bacterium]|nr:4-hydroxy-tetrahydrodipicolinate synthase [Lachnospiraceae bacterium]
MKKKLFTGAGTAIITPMLKDGSVDYESFGRFIDWQIDNGVDAIIAAATTGECATLNDAQHIEVIRYCVERAAGRVPVIGGTGSNDTAHGLHLTKEACEAGVDGILAVTPYYNKTTQKGLVRYFEEYAETSTVPVIVYNVPSRTGLNIEPETYGILSEHENIVGIKEANGNISKIAETMDIVGDRLDLYSGNDDQVVPLLSLGGIGVISVLSNVVPKETHDMVEKFLSGDTKGALDLQLRYTKLIKYLFSEVNPVPVKAACAAMGFCQNVLRSPLYPMEEAHEQVLLNEMRKLGIL